MENNDMIEETNKKKKVKLNILNIIMIILIIFGVLLVSNGIYNMVKGSSKKEDKKEVVDKRRSLNDKESKKYTDVVRVLSDNFAKYFYTGFDKITNQELLFFAMKENSFKDSISKNEVEKVIKKYFGSSKNVEHEDLKCLSDEELLYSLEGDNYVKKSHSNHSDIQNVRAYPLNMSSSIEKGKIVSYYYILFNDNCSDSCPLYGNIEKNGEALLNIAPLEGKPNEELVFTNESIQIVDEQLDITVFTFEDKNGEFVKISDIHIDEM